MEENLVRKASQNHRFARVQRDRPLTGAVVGAVLKMVWVLYLVETGGVLTSRQEQALVTRAAFSVVPVAPQWSAKVGKTSARALILSRPVVTVVVQAVELSMRLESDSSEGLPGNSHGLSCGDLIRRDCRTSHGDGFGRLDGCIYDDSIDRGAEVPTAVLGCFGQLRRRLRS